MKISDGPKPGFWIQISCLFVHCWQVHWGFWSRWPPVSSKQRGVHPAGLSLHLNCAPDAFGILFSTLSFQWNLNICHGCPPFVTLPDVAMFCVPAFRGWWRTWLWRTGPAWTSSSAPACWEIWAWPGGGLLVFSHRSPLPALGTPETQTARWHLPSEPRRRAGNGRFKKNLLKSIFSRECRDVGISRNDVSHLLAEMEEGGVDSLVVFSGRGLEINSPWEQRHFSYRSKTFLTH